MEIFFTISVAIICIVFIYIAFKHVSYHEKFDNQQIKKLTKKVKSKNK
jgi:uncharacterized membrane protein